MSKLGKLLRTRYFWYVAVAAVLAGIASYAPQLTGLSIRTDWAIAYYQAAYRLLFPIAAGLAAWRYRVKGGLIVCLITGPVILSGVLVNSRLPYAWVDFADIALGFLLSWFIGQQGTLKQRLEETTAELKEQSRALMTEVGERQRAEEQYRIIADHSADIIYKTTIKDEIFTFISPSAQRLLGYTIQEGLALKLTDILTPESYKKQHNLLLADTRNSASSRTFQLDLKHKDGHLVPFEVHANFVYNEKGEPEEIVGVARDVTERKKIEEQLIMHDRLASIGQLTSGLAHEINNPLTSIISLSSLLLQRKYAPETRQDIQIINDEGQRIAAIIKNLLAFSRQQPQEKRPTDINDCIRKVLEMHVYEQKVNNIQVNVNFDPALPQIIGNGSQLEQVFFHIVMNAEFFMREAHRRGTLNITTEKAGNSIRALFTDDGPGISQENMSQLFTPFFTTKEAGKGAGLGLSICLGIVNEHGGKLYADSEPEKGTTFVIELPVQVNPN
ncbi:MAG: ATP-binding protein [Dehalococcoidales bacterium]|jgi:PAS domain S-box-containing protein